MTPTDHEEEMTAQDYLVGQVIVPELFLLGGTILLAIAVRHGCPGIGGVFAFVLAAIALRLDKRMVAMIPPSMWSEEERQEAMRGALAICVIFTLLLLGVFLSTQISIGLLIVACLVRATVPIAFCVYWYQTFVDEIYPMIESGEFQNQIEELDRQTALAQKQARLAEANKDATVRIEDAQRQARRMKAVQEARQSVMKYYRTFAAVLRRFLSFDRLQTEIRSSIPDTATEEEAFAGACALLTRLEGFIQAAEKERQAEQSRILEQREKIAAIDRQIAAIGESITELQRNTTIDAELRTAELQSLEAKRRSLVEQRNLLLARLR